MGMNGAESGMASERGGAPPPPSGSGDAGPGAEVPVVVPPEQGGPPVVPEEPDWDAVGPDPVAELPLTEATDRLVVSTFRPVPSLLLIDLAVGRVIEFGPPTEPAPEAILGGTTIAYTLDDRTLGIVDVEDVDSVIEVPLPPDVPGEISEVRGDALGFVVTTHVTLNAQGHRRYGPLVLYGPGGDLRCITERDVPTMDVDLLDGVVRIDGLTTVVDRGGCATSHGLRDVADRSRTIGTINGAVLVDAYGALILHDPVTGFRKAQTEPLGHCVSPVLVAADAVWAMADGYLLKLDPATLHEVHRAGPVETIGLPLLFGAGGSVWVVEECNGFLAEVDPVTGNYVEAWWFPTAGIRAMELQVRVGDDGLWFADFDQTAEPHRFDFRTRRFEKTPIDRSIAHRIFTLDLVIPGA